MTDFSADKIETALEDIQTQAELNKTAVTRHVAIGDGTYWHIRVPYTMAKEEYTAIVMRMVNWNG